MEAAEECYEHCFENIYLRRSVRDYKPNDVPDDVIRELIKAGTYAPFSPYPTRHQPRRFVVIKNREMIDRLSERAKKNVARRGHGF